MDGLLVESVTTREPEFDTEQVDLLLASAAFEAGIGAHGFPMDEATSPEADPANRGGAYHYVTADAPVVDYVEKARKDSETAYGKKYKDANTNGHIWPVSRVDN